MIRIDTFKEHNFTVLREGNEKITCFYGTDPIAYIAGDVLFLKYSLDKTKNTVEIGEIYYNAMATFAKVFDRFYKTTVVNREVIESLTVTF